MPSPTSEHSSKGGRVLQYYRQLYPVTRYILRNIAEEFEGWVKE
jgi:hypothetical protein